MPLGPSTVRYWPRSHVGADALPATTCGSRNLYKPEEAVSLRREEGVVSLRREEGVAARGRGPPGKDTRHHSPRLGVGEQPDALDRGGGRTLKIDEVKQGNPGVNQVLVDWLSPSQRRAKLLHVEKPDEIAVPFQGEVQATAPPDAGDVDGVHVGTHGKLRGQLLGLGDGLLDDEQLAGLRVGEANE